MTTIRWMRAGAAVVGVAAVVTGYVWRTPHGDSHAAQPSGRGVLAQVASSRMLDGRTGRDDLAATRTAMRARLVTQPADGEAAVRLADVLLRDARASSNAGLAGEAETVLRRVLRGAPADYDARRMLAAVLLAQHRFGEAMAEAHRCREMRPRDAWPWGVLADAHIERGEYEDAFAAVERMLALRPDAGGYARASYARELQGDLNGALHFMRMAAGATSPLDTESLAWHHAQIGHLLLTQGANADARREFLHAGQLFPGHPFATEGLARADAADGRYAEALARVQVGLEAAPSPGVAALTGDLLRALGREDEAERQYLLAEAAWREDAPEPARLARFLVERGRRTGEALAMLQAESRRDIFTEDARAWAFFRSGRLAEAERAMQAALSTGTRDRVIRYHAAAIAQATGDEVAARRFVDEALAGAPRFDLIAAPDALVLRRTLGPAQVASR